MISINPISNFAFNFSVVHNQQINSYQLTASDSTQQYFDSLEKLNPFINEIKKSVIYIHGNRNVVRTQSIDSNNPKLDNAASNIHSVFHLLHNNFENNFDRIKDVFKMIFPEVLDVKTELKFNNTTNIELLMEGVPTPIPLQHCGSGYTHVLIVLYLLFAETEDRLILMDEPQSYLHPTAEKTVYELVAKHHQHKCLFTTHSPILINFPADKNLYLLQKENGRSEVRTIGDLQEVYKQIGLVNSDFALADSVLFVEGATEKEVLPKILAAFGMPQIGYNYSLISLNRTSDEFDASKLMARNADAYRALFSSISSQQIDYQILLDRDEKKKEELDKHYKGKVILLERREIENYFLNVRAITAVIQQELDERGNPEQLIMSSDKISLELQRILDYKQIDKESCYLNKQQTNGVIDIAGSRVLQKLFSQHNCTYSKPRHGLIFTDWFLEHDSEALKGIADTLAPFLLKQTKVLARYTVKKGLQPFKRYSKVLNK